MTTPKQRPGDVLYVVMAAIDDETDLDNFATADIVRAVRRDLDPSPTSDEVTTALDLLAHPSVNGLRAIDDGWQITDPVEIVASRLQALADAVADYRHGFNGDLTLDNRY